MNPKHPEAFQIFLQSMTLLGTHLLPIIGLSLIAALARIGVVDGFGMVPKSGKLTLEVVTEVSRAVLVLVMLGGGNVVKGVQSLSHISQVFEAEMWRTIGSNLTSHWVNILISLVAFSLVAASINACINLVANDGVLQSLKDWHLLARGANNQAIVLFLKNLTIIPFTIVFMYCLLAKLAVK